MLHHPGRAPWDRIVAPVHDAIMAQAPLEQAEDVSVALDRVMRDASAIVLRGYELPIDKQVIKRWSLLR